MGRETGRQPLNPVIWLLLLLAAVILTLYLTGCGSKYCAKRFPPVTGKDSITIERIVERDSLIYLPPDSSWVSMYIECDKQGKAWLRELADYRAGKYTPLPKVVIRDNYLTAECKIDSAAVHARWRETHRESVTTITVEKRVNFITGWQWFQLWCGRIFLGLSVLVIIYIVLKIVLKTKMPF